MPRRPKSSHQSVQHAIFGDEEAAAIRAELTELRALVGDLTAQVQAQFTSIAAHAEIARQHADFVRDEARADLARTRQSLTELLEQVRREADPFGPAAGGTRAPWAPPGPSLAVTADRVADLEAQLARAMDTVQHCFRRQQELAATMEALLDTVVFEARGEPVLRLA